MSEQAWATPLGWFCVSQIETGKRTGTTDVLLSVAKALNVTLDDIVISG